MANAETESKPVSDCALYFREWRKNHPGKNKEYCQRYWAKKVKAIKDQPQVNQETKTESA